MMLFKRNLNLLLLTPSKQQRKSGQLTQRFKRLMTRLKMNLPHWLSFLKPEKKLA